MVDIAATKIAIRLATLADTDFIAFTCVMGIAETEGLEKMLDREIVRSGVTNMINNPKIGCYYLAYVEGDEEQRPIGSAGVTYNMDVRKGGVVCWVETVFTVPEMRKKGVFGTLFNHITAWARTQSHVKSVRLDVEKENEGAIRTYKRLGMSDIGLEFNEVDWVYGDHD